MFLTLAAFAVMIGVLIFVHESGHFIAAKAVGIQVHRFSLGFGKPILSFRRGETEYCISALPFGGYVKMAGLEDEGMMGEVEGGASPVPVDPARAFDRKPLWARIIVILAGVTMNMILAYVVLVAMAVVTGLPEFATTRVDSVRIAGLPRGAEAFSQLHFDDRISQINGVATNGWLDIERAILQDSSPIAITVAGNAAPIRAILGDGSRKDRNQILEAITPLQVARMGLIQPGRPAYRAGAKPGDVVIRAGGDTIRAWSDFLHHVWATPGRPLHVDLMRDGVPVSIVMTPDSATEGDSIPGRPPVYGQIGVILDPVMRHVRQPLGPAVVDAVAQLGLQTVAIVGGFRDLVVGRLSIRRALSGPVAIAQVSGQSARLGSDWYLSLLLSFSINLAVLNLLPIPILDGGQLMFLLAEGVRRKPLSLGLRLRLTQIGFFFIVALMLFVVGNDVLNLISR
jgi:regulator of sigma E protease